MIEQSIQKFVDYTKKHIRGDEKGEAQIFIDHFFIALGFEEGLKGAGAECEFRIKNKEKRSTSFADLVWKPRVLIEMKKRGEALQKHYQQAFTYWQKLVPNRPQYVILCNFDEFWIYDFDFDIDEPVDIILIDNLVDRRQSISFMFPKPQKPIWGANKEEITDKAVKEVGYAFRAMIKRGIERKRALLYCMQCVISMFAEDIGLLPNNIFTNVVRECLTKAGGEPGIVPISYDLIGNLFKEMNTQGIAEGGMYKGVDYFNGGLFLDVNRIELTRFELERFQTAALKKWQKVNPAIFGSIFESALETDERHKLGAHYTHEIDIRKIVYPVIVKPWEKRIEEAKTLADYYKLIRELRNFKVLDPACGSGNFLFVAFKEMKKLEKTLLTLIRENATTREQAKEFLKFFEAGNYISTKQFYGIDIKPYAVELAKVTLMVAKELTIKEATDNSEALPLDNLDENIICADALLNKDGTERQWPEVDAIIGNPPYQSKNKMQKEFGKEYINKLRNVYSEVPGRADFCVYWYYKAHKHLKDNCYAGLVGTNTIRQNYSREGSLDYIVNNEGIIIDAVSSQKWSGEAAVYVSIASWKKGIEKGLKNLYYADDKEELILYEKELINSSLSLKTDVSSAKVLQCNKKPKMVFQGQTHGHAGFLLSVAKAKVILKKYPNYSKVLKPFLIGDELVANKKSQPKRFVIDFTQFDINEASGYKEIYKIIEKEVLPEREEKAKKQEENNELIISKNPKAKTNKHHINFYNKWWKLSYDRDDMIKNINKLTRYIACSRITLRPIFEFIDKAINPNDALIVFPFEDDYTFGIIQSKLHWIWFTEKCSTLEGRYRYTTNTVWDTFPWPQKTTKKQIAKIANASKAIRDERNAIMEKNKSTLRDVYRVLEKPGKNKLKDLHNNLDKAVMEAYGFDAKTDILQQLLELNKKVAQLETDKKEVQAPGLPDWIIDKQKYISDDCVKFIR
jgi:SAM-dependent methyltransferase